MAMSIGMGLGPIIALPFLQQQTGVESSSDVQQHFNFTTLQQNNDTEEFTTEQTVIAFLFPTLAAISLLVTVIHIFLYTSACRRTKPPPTQSDDTKNLDKSRVPFRIYLLILPHYFVNFFFGSIESVLAALTLAYYTMYLHWSTAEAAALLFGFQMVKIVGTIMTMALINWTGVKRTLVIQVVSVLAVSIIFVAFIEKAKYVTWIYMVVVSLNSSCLPLILSWVREIVPINAALSGAFLSTFPVNELVFPVLVANLLVRYGLYVYPVYMLACACCSALMVCIAWVMGVLCPELYIRQDESIELLDNNNK
jgi:hypothetical protein